MRPDNNTASNRRRRARAALMLTAMLPLIAACTITTPSAPPTTSTPGSSASPTHVTASSPAAKPGTLLCADAYTTQPSGTTPIAFTPAGIGFDALSKVGFDPIPAIQGGLNLPPDAPQYISKSPIHLDHGVSWAEITLIHGDVTLAWVPATVWTGGRSLAPYLAKTARFESCNGSHTGFLGGVLTATPNECITLGLRSNLHPKVEPLEVSIGKHACG